MTEELGRLARSEFKKAAGAAGRLGLLDCRCCLLSVYGVDKSERAIAEVWLSLPSSDTASLSDEEVLARGIDLETFLGIAKALLEADCIAETTQCGRLYEVFDLKHKGFVSLADFERVLVASGRTQLARQRAPQLFSRLDELGIQKISVTQLKAALLARR